MERRILILHIVMLLTFAAGACVNASAQDYVAPPVSISKDKVKIDGKVFYSHIVLDKQTLYSISKAYNVTIDEIHKYNPSVKENGLRKNDIINIPVVDAPQQKTEEEIAPQQVVQENAPAPSAQPQSEPKTITAIQGRHTVKWYEDLAAIASKYNISEEAIMMANGLKDKKLKNRQVLVIPVADNHVESHVEAEVPESEEEQNIVKAEESDDIEQYAADSTYFEDFFASFWKAPVHATLILPFKATGSTGSKNHMDFYSGVLLAAKEMKDNEIELHLDVYDMAAGTAGIDVETLRSSDLIIGPVSPDDITKIHKMTGGACPVISPLDQKAEKLTSTCSNLIQVPASQYAQFDDIAEWIKEDSQTGDRIIVISEKEARQNDAGRVLRTIIDRKEVDYTPFSYSILEGRDIQERLEGAMTAEGVNRVVIASESEAFVNDAVRNLNLIVHNKFQVVLYAPAKIRTFETIEVENFHNTSLHASLTYNIDYEDKKVQDFIRRYRAMFNTEPTQFAFQGYDIARYFVGLASRYQKGWTSHLEDEDAEMLQNSFKFRLNGNTGYLNNGIRRIIYGNDYSIEEVL